MSAIFYSGIDNVPNSGGLCVELGRKKVDRFNAIFPGAQFFVVSGPDVLSADSLSRVVCLFNVGGPAAIAEFVVSIVFNSVDGHSCGGFPHIGEEIEEIIAPPVAYDDAAPAVAGVCGVGAGVTAGLHSLPNFVGWGFGVSMDALSGGGQFAVQTSAGFGPAATKIAAINDGLIAAFALTNPAKLAMRGGLPDNGISTGFEPEHVDCATHWKVPSSMKCDHLTHEGMTQ